MSFDQTSIRVRVVTAGGTLVGKMSKPKGIRTLDALNLKGDFFALTEAEIEGSAQPHYAFIAVNKNQVLFLEELS